MARVLTPIRRRVVRFVTAVLPATAGLVILSMNPCASSLPRWMAAAPMRDRGIEDVYKALHQAWRGPGHMIPSREMAEAYLTREWAGLEHALPGEALVETLEVGAPFMRLNMRPYRDAGGSADSLLEAFLRSAAMPTDSAAFVRDWEAVGRACERGELPFTRAAFDSIDGSTRKAGYPAIHHSAAYTARYRPAYRVLSGSEVDRLVGPLVRDKEDR